MDNAKIIAVDFDGTLVENKWPEIGAPIEKTSPRLRPNRKLAPKSFFGRTASANLWKKRLHFVRRMASILMLSIRIFPKSSKHLGLTAGRSSPMNIGMIAQS